MSKTDLVYRRPVIVFWDLETSHNIVATFQLYQPIIPHSCIIKEKSIICASWKYLGKKGTHSVSILDDAKRYKADRGDDYVIVKALHEMISSADVLVAHNGDKFDYKYFNTRCLFHGLTPVDKPITIDTYKVAKRHFNFNSNRLDYLGQFLGLGRKLHTHVGMWMDIVNDKVSGEEAAKSVRKMLTYNKQDVILLEAVYKRLRPYITSHPNVALLANSSSHSCPTCNSLKVQARGYRTTRTGKYQRYQCIDCGAWSSGGKSIITTVLR